MSSLGLQIGRKRTAENAWLRNHSSSFRLIKMKTREFGKESLEGGPATTFRFLRIICMNSLLSPANKRKNPLRIDVEADFNLIHLEGGRNWKVIIKVSRASSNDSIFSSRSLPSSALSQRPLQPSRILEETFGTVSTSHLRQLSPRKFLGTFPRNGVEGFATFPFYLKNNITVDFANSILRLGKGIQSVRE